MTPLWRRLAPTATTVAEVRWSSPYSVSVDVLVRRFRRERDAVNFARKLRRDKDVVDVRVHVAPIGRWREVPLDPPGDNAWRW